MSLIGDFKKIDPAFTIASLALGVAIGGVAGAVYVANRQNKVINDLAAVTHANAQVTLNLVNHVARSMPKPFDSQ